MLRFAFQFFFIMFCASAIEAQPRVGSEELHDPHAWRKVVEKISKPTFDLSTIDRLPIMLGADIRQDSNFVASQLLVKLQFQPQVIGGVIHVEAYVMPFFTGVGLVNRPTVSYTYAQAVDGIDHELLGNILLEMQEEIKRESKDSVATLVTSIPQR